MTSNATGYVTVGSETVWFNELPDPYVVFQIPNNFSRRELENKYRELKQKFALGESEVDSPPPIWTLFADPMLRTMLVASVTFAAAR